MTQWGSLQLGNAHKIKKNNRKNLTPKLPGGQEVCGVWWLQRVMLGPDSPVWWCCWEPLVWWWWCFLEPVRRHTMIYNGYLYKAFSSQIVWSYLGKRHSCWSSTSRCHASLCLCLHLGQSLLWNHQQLSTLTAYQHHPWTKLHIYIYIHIIWCSLF